MYPDLSYFFNDLLGTDVDNWTSIFKTFGVMLVLSLTACGVFLRSELLRLEKSGLIKPILVDSKSKKSSLGEILTNGLFTVFIGAKLPMLINEFDNFKGDPASLIFSSKGYWMIGLILGVLSVIYSYYLNSKLSPEENESKQVFQYASAKTGDIIIAAGLSGVVGSKLFSIFENLGGFFDDPIGTFFSSSGLNIYGGLIVAFFVVAWYVKSIGIKPIYMMDIGGMGILLGYALGRVGCQLSGDGDWGIVASPQPSWWFLPDWVWSQSYPNNVNNDGVLMQGINEATFNTARATMSVEDACKTASGVRYCHELNPKVFPTPIYETFFGLLAFAILFFNKHKFKIPGTLFFIYMIVNGIERFLIEIIRVNDRYSLLGMNYSQAQYISILFVIIGVTGLIYLLKFGKSDSFDTSNV